MLQCDLHWYSFRLFRDWITEREQDGRYESGPCFTNWRRLSPVHPGVSLHLSLCYNENSPYVCFTGSISSSSGRRKRPWRAPDNNTMLELYALFINRRLRAMLPGGFDFVRRAKFDAWSEIKGTSAEDAMQQ
jgi:hypothetical protein